MPENLHIHERIDNILTVLNNIPLKGFDQIAAVTDVMRALATLDKDIREATEQKEEE